MLIRSVRALAGEPSIGTIGTLKTRLSAVAITGFLYSSWNCPSSSGSAAFQSSLRGVLMMSSFTSGLAMAEAWTSDDESAVSCGDGRPVHLRRVDVAVL